MLGSRSESRIAIAQGTFERPSVSLRMLPNVGPTFLQRGGDSQGCGAAGSRISAQGIGEGCPAGGAGTSPGAYAEGLTDARVRFVRRHWSRPFRPRGGVVGGGGFCPNGTTLKPLRAGWMKSNHPDLRIYERILQAVAS